MATNRNDERSEARKPDEIERDIAQTREAIDSTVDELGQRLAPRQLMDDAKSYVKESAMRRANSLWSTVNDNAIPLALIGGGVAWMLSSRGTGPPSAADWHADSGPGVAARTAEKAREVTDRVRERSGEVTATAQRQLTRARTSFESMQEEQPLLIGVAALALGALVGGALPSTRREDELVGQVRDEVVGAAVEAGREKVEQARQSESAIGIENEPRDAGPRTERRPGREHSPSPSPRP